jgi:DNA topoisomerase-1
VSDTTPGITRKRRGKGFSYVDPRGATIADETTLARIRKLAIPPAYTDVWICPDPRGHIQATGRDARGRKQYRYHERWREARDETKFGRMLAFSEALPDIRRRVDEDLKRPALPREKVLATVVRLLESTCIRVGNDEYSRTNDSYGLTTLEDQHATITGTTVRFRFRGKGGKAHEVALADRRLARIVQRCQELPGEQLFQYLDEAGAVVDVTSGDVNQYLREIGGQEFTAKDFRTWAGTLLAAQALRAIGAGATQKEIKANIVGAVDRVSARLNNTRAVCRKYYVHPAVLERYAAGQLAEALGALERGPSTDPYALSAEERALVHMLRESSATAKAA